MTNTATETLSVVVEREIAYPPEKIWRALTQPHLIEEWLMKNDFKPVVDHRFNLRADWGAVDCQVMAVEPNKTLSYTWAAYGLESVVTWTLTPTSTGTHLRMEQSGFRPDQQQAYQGAQGRVAAVLCQPGAGLGAARLKLFGTRQSVMLVFVFAYHSLGIEGETRVNKSGSQKSESPSRLIDARINELGDWRGEMLSRLRPLVKEADPESAELICFTNGLRLA